MLAYRWSAIAARLPGRTDNEIKNYWNTHIRKKLLRAGVDPVTHQQLPPDHSGHLDAASSAAFLPEALLWASAAATLGGMTSPSIWDGADMMTSQCCWLDPDAKGICIVDRASRRTLRVVDRP